MLNKKNESIEEIYDNLNVVSCDNDEVVIEICKLIFSNKLNYSQAKEVLHRADETLKYKALTNILE